jgi:aminopeptidase N
MFRRSTLLLALLFLFISACQTTPKQSAPNEESSDLTWEQAMERSSRLSEVKYRLKVDLTGPSESFSGESEIEFHLTSASQPLRLDFFEGRVTSLQVNGTAVDLSAKKPYWIELPAAALKTGTNRVRVVYTHEYSHQGQGLHRFKDPETREIFLYTQFETFDANRFMPCFDQPDLRSTLDLTVTAPASWEVISTTREAKKDTAGGGVRTWVFPTTPKLATYLFSLHAGPYKVWTDRFEKTPLRLFARPAMAKYVDAKKWFLITKQGLKFFNSYYKLPYPFLKYDQVIVPEFNAGAMENVGAVTFSEEYLSRSKMRRDQWRRAANVILHEMAHMWFGDLVTMRWWNDLWLNESFATYMAGLAMDEATEFHEAWQDFFAGDKSWAYWEDSLSTTHPIEAPVKTVKQAFANFDGITYGKGASVLKQLSAYMGASHFQKGVQNYLSRFSYQNAELKDFIASLQEQTPKDLNLWADRWLRQSGTDQIALQWTCEGPRLKELTVKQTPAKNARFRPQTFSVSFHRLTKGRLPIVRAVNVDLDEPVKTVTGDWECPDFLYPNFGDNGYFSVQLDPKSLATAKEHLSVLENDHLRTMVWLDLWRMVRHAQMPLKDYVEFVDRHFPPEKDEILQREIVETVSGRRSDEGTLIYYWPEQPEKSRFEKEQFIGRVEQQYRERFEKSKAGSDEQKFWFDAFMHVARTARTLDDLAAWVKKPQVAAGFPWDLDRQWRIAQKLARFNHPAAEPFLATMKKKDPSERGKKQALAAEAVRPDLSIKRKWIDVLKEPKPKISFAEARSVLGSLFPVEQASLARQFEADFYDYLKTNGDSENEVFVESFAGAMAPLHCDRDQTTRLKKFVSSGASFSPSVRKALLVGIEEDERCQKIRGLSAL